MPRDGIPSDSDLTINAGGTLIFDPSVTAVAGQPLVARGGEINPVPEPGTIALLLAAFWSAAIYCRFRRKAFGGRKISSWKAEVKKGKWPGYTGEKEDGNRKRRSAFIFLSTIFLSEKNPARRPQRKRN